MKILCLHSDFIEIEPKQKAIKSAEDIEKVKKRIEECLVVFTSVEEGDSKDIIDNAAEEINKISGQVKCDNIVIYPFVHLSGKPAPPELAMEILKELESKFPNSYRAPFGWYKAFNIKCKGHPLAELSREIKVIAGSAKDEEDISGALKDEEKVKSKWYIMEPNGKLAEADKFDFKNSENLKKFYNYEIAKQREDKGVPAHVKYMKKLELANTEEGSDSGNLKYYPKGRLIKSLLEQWVTQKVIEYGGMEVETPIMYDYEHPALKDYLNRFPARQYVVESAKKKFFLRFAACFGQFLMKANSVISYRNLPLKMYELTRYSFRLEKRGELSGLRRQRAFTMPDMHTVCKDMEQAMEEFKNQFNLSMSCMQDLGFGKEDYELAIRFTEDFWSGNKEFVESLGKIFGRPVLIEMWSFRFAYFDPKFEFNMIDTLDKAGALSTVQIDHENAKRYGIKYTSEDNSRKTPMILHCSPSGGIERCMWALIEHSVKTQKNPELPLWLSPTQIRICPMNDSLVEYCEKLADEISKENIRADVDDRKESVQKKVRDSELEWNPYTVVVGEKEKESGLLAVRFRETAGVENMKKEELVKMIKDKTKGFPFKPLPLPRLLSKRPIFVG